MRLIILAAALITPFAAAAGDSLSSYDRTLPSEYQKAPQFRQNWKTSVSSYQLRSSSASGLFSEISEKSPRSGKDAGSITKASFSITWDLDYQQKKDFCEFYGAEVNVEVRFTIPEWNSPEATDEERRQWDEFLGKLNSYNEYNKKIVKDEIDRLGSSLTGLRPVKTCQELQQNADQVGGGYLSIIARKLSNFREETQGGRVYGLEYPVFSQTEYVNAETGEVIRKGESAGQADRQPDEARERRLAEEKAARERRDEIERRESALVDEDEGGAKDRRTAAASPAAKPAGKGKTDAGKSPSGKAGSAAGTAQAKESSTGKSRKDSSESLTASGGSSGKAQAKSDGRKPWPQARPATDSEKKGSAAASGKDSGSASATAARKAGDGNGKTAAAQGGKDTAPAAATMAKPETGKIAATGSTKDSAAKKPAAAPAPKPSPETAAAPREQLRDTADYSAQRPAGSSTGRRQIIIRSGHKPITNYGSGELHETAPAASAGSSGKASGTAGEQGQGSSKKGSGYDSSQLDRMFGN